MLSREDSAEPGRWRTSRFEAQRGIMDAPREPGVRKVVVKKGSQVGWTAICGNVVGYHIDQDPCPILFMQPTLGMAEAYSKDRLAPLLRDTPCLRGAVRDPRSRDSGNTILHKEFAGGHLTLIGANAPSALASRPIRIVIQDEVDRYPTSAGGEGDPQRLAEKRQATFWNAVTFVGGTPVYKGGPIDRDFERSDKRMRFARCPHCAEHGPEKGFQTLKWEQVKFDRDADGELIEESVGYQCEHCGTLWDDADRHAAEKAGEWRATAPFRGVAGFFLSQLYSPWVPMARMVREFLDAKDNPELLQVFVNTVLGEGWEEQGEKVDGDSLQSRAEPYGPHDLPEGVITATAGVDVQDDRIEVQLIGWGHGDEAWPFLVRVLPGDPAESEVWDRLDSLLLERFRTRTGRLVRIKAACIDTGGHHTDAVHRFCRGKARRRVYAIQGKDGNRPIWPERYTLSRKTKSPLRIIGVDTAKGRIHGCLRIAAPRGDEPKPGYVHFPTHEIDDEGRENGFGPEYYRQLTVEEVRTKYTHGRAHRYWWKPNGARNEALDTFVYALAARKSLPTDLGRYVETITDTPPTPRDVPSAAVIEAQRTPLTTNAAPAPSKTRRGRSNWLGTRRTGGWLGR